MKDLRRINNQRFSIRAVNILNELNIKTIGKAKETLKNIKINSKVGRFKVTNRVINEILNFN